MAHDEFSSAKKHWKHWVVYATITFLSIFVFAEFALSVSFISILAPSTFMFYFTPVGFFVGEALVSFFASVLLFLGLFTVLRLKVYVKTDESLRFNRSDSYLLLPFYLIPLASLGIYISLIPLELSNILTYLIFLILFESFIEHVQVSDYGMESFGTLKEKISRVKAGMSGAKPPWADNTLEDMKEVTGVQKSEQKTTKLDAKASSDTDVEDMVEDLQEVLGEEEAIERDVPKDEKPDLKEEDIEELLKIPSIGRSRAKKLYREGFKTPQDIVEKGLSGLAGIEHVGMRTARKILDNAKKIQKEKPEDDSLEAELEELEKLLDGEDE